MAALTHVGESSRLLAMTKRLQVLFEDDELRELQRLARQHRMTTAEWVRRSLRAARDAESSADVGQKLAAIRTAAAFSFPTADIDTLLAEIEGGYQAIDAE
jgi:glucose-6-phosphate-specific signal transduction histidine kinase